MNQEIQINDINNSTDDNIILQYIKDFKAIKCLYCFQDNQKFLAQCKECGYYFCNNIHRKTSHIILHLKQCKHKKVSLAPFTDELACENCRSKNIFELCFKSNQILCEVCIEENDEEGFKKIVEEKKISNEILVCPDLPPVANRCDSYSESFISRINNKILKMKELGIDDVVNINYTNKKNYCNKYKYLVETEKNLVIKENEEEDFFEYKLKFSGDSSGYITAEIVNDKKKEFLFYMRQFLLVARKTNRNKTESAKVIKIDKEKNIVTIYFKDLDKTMNDDTYLIKEKESTESLDRIIDGLEKLKMENLNLFDKNILELIIGSETNEEKDNKNKYLNENDYLNKSKLPQKLNIAKFENSELNKSQEEAIRNCFRNKLTLIRGPPGTGKTKVLATIAFHLLELKRGSTDKIFMGAPSNRAVDNISYYLQKLGLPFIRVLSLEKEFSEDVDKTNSLDELINQEIEKDLASKLGLKKFKELREKKLKFGKLKKEDNEKYKKITKEYEQKLLSSFPIILSTINNSADERLKDFYFPMVLIDEATQAIEPDTLLPLYHKAQMVVMIGDEKQLGPTVKSQEANIAGLGISLFERLCFYYKGSSFISNLNEQYRMHSTLYEFSNKHFYDNMMKTHGEIQLDENVKNNFPWPNKEIPTFFWNSVQREEKENDSFFNKKEMYNAYGVVQKLEKAGVKMSDIGIITPYKAQKLKLQFDKFYDKRFDDLKIESVDGFQGMEKEYIIISAVRSNLSGKIGFLRSPKRLNVSLTRARKGVIILGNAECLSKRNGIWRDLLKFYKSRKLIVQGQLNNLEQVPNEELPVDEIIEDEEIIKDEEDDEEIKKGKIDQHLNLDKQTSSDLAWGMPAPPAEEEEEEEEKDENKIVGLDIKKKDKKNKNKKDKKEKNEENKIEDEKEEKKKKKNEEENSDSDNEKKGKKKNKKKGKK